MSGSAWRNPESFLGDVRLRNFSTGFFRAETTPRKIPTACPGTEKRKGNDKKARSV
jgi:hypothetical protein